MSNKIAHLLLFPLLTSYLAADTHLQTSTYSFPVGKTWKTDADHSFACDYLFKYTNGVSTMRAQQLDGSCVYPFSSSNT